MLEFILFSALLQVSGHTSVEVSLVFLSLGFLECPELEFLVLNLLRSTECVQEEGRVLPHELWGGSSGICEACGTSVHVHAERSLHKVMFKKDFETLWCELLSKSRTLQRNKAQPIIVIQFWLQLLIVQRIF